MKRKENNVSLSINDRVRGERRGKIRKIGCRQFIYYEFSAKQSVQRACHKYAELLIKKK